MSDDRIGGFANKLGPSLMRALSDTAGMTAPEQAAFWLEKIAARVHRGPRVDTWASARDRAAKLADIRPSMAERIWHRWRDMKDVSGDALVKLMIAYEKVCDASDARGDAFRDERFELRGLYAATKQEPASGGQRVGAPHA